MLYLLLVVFKFKLTKIKISKMADIRDAITMIRSPESQRMLNTNCIS